MCGIVGLHLRTPELYPRLGELLSGMLGEMSDRGADSAGVAVYGDPMWSPPGRGCVSVTDIEVVPDLGADVDVVQVDSSYLLSADMPSEALLERVRLSYPGALIAGFGADLAVLKGVGHPRALTDTWGLSKAQGWQGVGHTRMATESAVTPDRAHPFTAGEDFCLVHNGSLSNPNGIRRMLEPRGIRFETDNDTEAACRFLEWRLREGDDLETALQRGFEELDGFYTFLMGTPDKLALIRDPFACKPAVVAETDDYVAIASEFRSLAHLPGVKHAHVFEPAPEEMYVWNA